MLVEESPVEGLFGARRFSFQPIQHLLVQEHFGSLGHGTFVDHIIDAIEDRVGGDFPLGQPIERFHLFGEPLDGGRKRRALFVQVLVLPVEDVP